ncbi:PAS domain-containing protein [Sorangium sp. So ce1036]|uniref:PAS domain-containing protein n=1 Tax=Sorangium sp. So ce1036 TaxID=3133328 RepID=UPI003F04263B
MSHEQSLTALEAEIAALRQRVAELEGAQAKLEALSSVLPSFIAVFNREGIIVEMIPTLLFSVEMITTELGMPLARVIKPGHADRCLALIREALETRTTLSIEYPLPWGEREVWCHAVCKPLTGDTVLWIANDITAQRKRAHAQAELRDFQALVEYAPDGVCLASQEGALFYENPAFRAMTGHAEGAPFPSLFEVFAAPRDELSAIVQRCFRRASWQGTLSLAQPGGRTVPCQVSMVALAAEHGRPPGVAVLARDLTPIHEAERERLALQEQVIQAQQATLRELSTPLVPLAEGVVAMPLIGTFDRTRAQQAMEKLLDGIVQHQLHTVIVDVTGVRDVDAESADALLRIARAARLLGARLLLTGINPDTAQSLVDLGVDLGGIATHSTLQSGIAHVLARRPVAPRAAAAPGPRDGTPAQNAP